MRLLLLTALAFAALASFALAAPAHAAELHITPAGSDTAACTATAPCRTIPRAATVAVAGDDIAVHAGTYAGGSGTTISKPGIQVRAAVGETPVLTGAWRATGDDQEWGPGLKFDASGSSMIRNFDIRADRVDFHHNEATGGEDGACVLVGNVASAGSKIRDNHIHDCGSTDSSRANLDHCIYAGDPVGLLVANNVIADCVSRGVQLYPAGSGAQIVNNTVIRAGRNGILSNGNDNATVANNVIVDSGHKFAATDHKYAVRVTSDSTGVTVRRNVFWGNAINGVAGGATVTENLTADPLLAGWRLSAGSPAIGWADPLLAPLSDFEGDLRDGAPDAGADEYIAPAPTPTPEPEPSGEPTPESCG